MPMSIHLGLIWKSFLRSQERQRLYQERQDRELDEAVEMDEKTLVDDESDNTK